MATKIPHAVATNASLIAGAIIEKATFDWFANFANDSNIPITVPKRPIKGDVEEIIANQEIPELASLIILISQACNSSLELMLFVHLFNADNDENLASLDVNPSSDLTSFLISAVTAKYL